MSATGTQRPETGTAREASERPTRCSPRRRRRASRHRRWLTRLILCLFALVFAAKLANYMFPEAIRFSSIGAFFTRLHNGAESWYENNPAFHSCAEGLQMRDVSGGYVCAPQAPTPTKLAAVRAHIFDRYPLDGNVREAIYTSIRAGTLKGGEDLMRDVVDVPRYQPVAISAADRWRADPYKAVYWRFYYYSMRPTVDLLSAFESTGNRGYARQLIAIDESFFGAESSSTLAWADPHAVAFRGLVLGYEWWELRRLHALTLAQSAQYLAEIQKTANFLLDRNHYQPEMNHGTNESAALFEIAVDFPTLPGAPDWLATSRLRLAESLHLLIDADGALIENSPYYHFYELDKYWQIYQFSLKTHTPVAPDFSSRLADMVRYATFILQPNDSVPLLGASLEQTFRYHGTYTSIGERYPQLRYVLTQGRSGERPSATSRFFPASGRTVMRSGWGTGSTFENQAYLTFNVGKYRTAHSSLDALGFTLYDNGATLMPGPGLYTYAHDRMRAYFHGTASHNTVVVDGNSQEQGNAFAGPLIKRDGVTWQSGESGLYPGVAHQRTLMMIDKNHFLVIDRLRSQTEHTYQQMFHLFPGARVGRSGLTVDAHGPTPEQSLQITQLAPAQISLQTSIGRYDPPSGLCSTQYQIAVGCYELAYTQHAQNASYATLLSVGPRDPRVALSYDQAHGRVLVHDDGRVLEIALGESVGRTESVHATHPKAPVAVATPLAGTANLAQWQASGAGSAKVSVAADDGGRPMIEMSASSGNREMIGDDAVQASLASSNLQVRVKVTNAQRVDSLTLALSNRHFASSARIQLLDSYQPRYSGDWMTISLGRESHMSWKGGHWQLDGSQFNWGAVDAVSLTMLAKSGPGPAPTVQLESISSMPQQRSGAVAFVFDDGYESILPAAAAMHSLGMAGSVAVIGKFAELPAYGHLNVYELRMLQNRWGWNMVNHTQMHADAVADYYRRGALGAYEQDILDGATFLEQAGLDSAPNWLIYPHGTTNTVLDSVVSRFYTFARTTNDAPEAFPYGSPLRVKTFEVHSPNDSGDGGSAALTAPAHVLSAARDALAYHSTLIVTMHRIDALPTDSRGYPLTDFVQILNGIKRLHIPVLTLSQLDKLDGVPETARITLRPAIPSLITVTITAAAGRSASWYPPPWLLISLAAGACVAAALSSRHRERRQALQRQEHRERERVGV
jgi:hypothetical protein